MAVYNTEEYLVEAIQSVIDQDIGFLDNVQLILVDDGSTDNSYNICLNYQEKYPDNIFAITKENEGQGSARNLGLEYVNAEFINFLDSDDKFSLNTLSAVYDFFLEHYDEIDVVSIPLRFFGSKEGEHGLNYKFKSERVVDLVRSPQNPQLSMSSSFIKSEAFKGFKFNTNLVTGEDAIILSEILLEKKKIGFLNSAKYFYRKRLNSSSTVDNANQRKEYFTPRLRDYFKELINYCIEKEGHVADFVQYLIAYDAQWFYEISDFPENFSKDEINEFWENFYDVLSFIDEDVINSSIIFENVVRLFFMYLKNQQEFHVDIVEDESKIFLKTGDFVINNLHDNKIYFDELNLENGVLNLLGDFTSSCSDNALTIGVVKTLSDGTVEQYIEELDEYSYEDSVKNRFLGIDWVFNHKFHLKIPIGENEESKITFNVCYSENDMKIYLKNDIQLRNSTHFSNILNYAVKDSKIIYFNENSLFIYPFSENKINELRDKVLLTIGGLLENKKHLTKENKDLNRKNYSLNKKNKKLSKNLDKVKRKNEEIINSKSWKLTKPFRNVMKKLKLFI